MNDGNDRVAHVTEVEAALVLLKKMGITPADLLRAPSPSLAAPTFTEYVPRVSDAVSSGTRRVYGSYWNRVLRVWGPRPITDISASDISQLAEQIKATVVTRRNARGGRGAAEHLIAALRCMYKYAVADGIIAESENPAARVAKPRRLRSTRRALPDDRLEELCRVAASTGDDPALDSLLLRLHIETACRRGGALALTADDLDQAQCLIQLHEKGETVRWQPVSSTLMSHLLAHADSRGGPGSGQRLLRYANGRAITSRRYDYLWQRLGCELPWVATQQVSMHWIRHTVLTWVERHFGFATAQAYAGHEEHGRGGKTMATYVRAGLPEVATALAALTGESHPLAVAPTGVLGEERSALAGRISLWLCSAVSTANKTGQPGRQIVGGGAAACHTSRVSVTILEREMYTEAAAARLLRVAPSTLHWWLEGRPPRYRPVIRVEPTGSRNVTWAEFVEAGLLRSYRREHDVPLKELRDFIDRLREEFQVPYPLADRRPYVGSGRRLLIDLQDRSHLDSEFCLVAVANGQIVLTAPGEEFYERVDWSGDEPAGWRPHEDSVSPVRINPLVRFGMPAIGGISTEAIAGEIDGGASVEEVAGDFGLDIDAVRWAQSYELSQRAAG